MENRQTKSVFGMIDAWLSWEVRRLGRWEGRTALRHRHDARHRARRPPQTPKAHPNALTAASCEPLRLTRSRFVPQNGLTFGRQCCAPACRTRRAMIELLVFQQYEYEHEYL